jgi:uncharacterized protein (DUF983 family)
MSPIEISTAEPEEGALPALKRKPRPLFQAIRRGARRRCPVCGEGPLFTGYLATQEQCPKCGEELHHHRADDAPPYLTILITAHIVVPMIVSAEAAYAPPVWIHMALWAPLTAGLSLFLLPRIKGAVIGVQWALGMHGFDPDEDARSSL